MQIEAVLFDIDGTLVDSNSQHVLAWEEAFATIGEHFDRQRIHDQIGKGTDMLVPTLLPALADDAVERLGEAHGRIFKAKYLTAIRPFDHAHALLAHVAARGIKVVLASSAGQEELDHYITLLDARDFVAATTSSDDVKHTTPAPDIFATALEKIGGTAETAIVVGDTPYDVEAALKCGIAAVAVRSGGLSTESLSAAGAIALYEDVAALSAGYDDSRIARFVPSVG